MKVCVQTFIQMDVKGQVLEYELLCVTLLIVCQSVCGKAEVQLSRNFTVPPSCLSSICRLTLCCFYTFLTNSSSPTC